MNGVVTKKFEVDVLSLLYVYVNKLIMYSIVRLVMVTNMLLMKLSLPSWI